MFENDVQPPTTLTTTDGQAAVVNGDPNSGAACIKLSGQAGKDARTVLGNLNLAIRVNPRFGEYRYLRFAWRKTGGGQIGLELDYQQTSDVQRRDTDRWRRVDAVRQLAAAKAEERQLKEVMQMMQARPTETSQGINPLAGMQRRQQQMKRIEESLKSQLDDMSREVAVDAAGGIRSKLRYYTGTAQAAALPADVRGVKAADRQPEEWSVVTCDLAQDCGNAQLLSIALVNHGGGDARLDHVFLARTPQDFERGGK